MTTPIRISLRNEMLVNREEVLTLWTRFWRALCLYSYRHWRTSYRGRPVGVPGERDPFFPCSAYAPRPSYPGDQPICLYPDNHYLCDQCSANATRHRLPSHHQVPLSRTAPDVAPTLQP